MVWIRYSINTYIPFYTETLLDCWLNLKFLSSHLNVGYLQIQWSLIPVNARYFKRRMIWFVYSQAELKWDCNMADWRLNLIHRTNLFWYSTEPITDSVKKTFVYNYNNTICFQTRPSDIQLFVCHSEQWCLLFKRHSSVQLQGYAHF